MRSTKDDAEQIARVLRSLAAQRCRWRLDPDSQLSERERGLGAAAPQLDQIREDRLP